jgi:uncharacterized protein YxjI
MSTYFIKQAVFSWTDKFTIKDEAGQDRFFVSGKILSWGKNLTLTDGSGAELANVKQKILSFTPTFEISYDGKVVGKVVKKFQLFKNDFRIDDLGWEVKGDILGHDFTLVAPQGVVATVSKAWFSWGDSYRVDIDQSVPPSLVLALVIAIDAGMEDEDAAAAVDTFGNP